VNLRSYLADVFLDQAKLGTLTATPTAPAAASSPPLAAQILGADRATWTWRCSS
jgi:hypothetical protein